MKIAFQFVQLRKRHPLRISRGVSRGGTSLFVRVSEGGHTGLGEMCPSELTGAATAEAGLAHLQRLWASGLEGLAIEQIWARGHRMRVAPCALAALDMALWDLRAKQAGMPLHVLLGLGLPTVPTSVTIGINPPEVVRERVPELLRDGARYLKVKLGSPEGLAADRAMYEAAAEAAAPFRVGLRVDANGGWSLADALLMLPWLAAAGADYVEQPLALGNEAALPLLFGKRALPIFVDESCFYSQDIPAWANAVDGVNLKLMKCGGISEALRIVATARAHGLQTMIGCNGESSVSIAAGAALGALFDHIDLDSHLNLAPDPATGAALVDGVVLPSGRTGHGAELLA